MHVWDAEGRRYIDFYGGHCVCCLGHSPTPVAEAIAEQARTLMFYSNLAPSPIREEAAKAIVDYASNGLTKVFFCNSGAEANENALKIAIKSTGRRKIAAFTGSFHGRTLLALGATDNRGWHQLFPGWVGEVVRLTPNRLDDLSRIDDSIGAVILEPIQSIGGCTVFESAYLSELRRVCSRHGVLLIFDEVQTGLGRTGYPFASGHWGVLPDMMTLAKGVAAGFAAGAVVMTEAIADAISAGDIAATFGGGPMACAAVKATVRALKAENLASHAAEMERYVRERFVLPEITEVRGKGLLLGLVLDRPAKPVQKALFGKGIITGLNSNPALLHLLPPLVVQKAHFDELHSALEEVFRGEPGNSAP
jgi:acetylornithine/succinyldiaminopimelate/putrescine aminotransferase